MEKVLNLTISLKMFCFEVMAFLKLLNVCVVSHKNSVILMYTMCVW